MLRLPEICNVIELTYESFEIELLSRFVRETDNLIWLDPKRDEIRWKL